MQRRKRNGSQKKAMTPLRNEGRDLNTQSCEKRGNEKKNEKRSVGQNGSRGGERRAGAYLMASQSGAGGNSLSICPKRISERRTCVLQSCISRLRIVSARAWGGGGRERNKAGGGNALVGRLAAQPMCLRSGKRKNGRSLSVRQSRTARTNTRDKDTPRKGGTKGGIVSAEVVPVQTDIHGEAHREDGQEEGGEVENEDGQGGREREGSWW